MGCLQTYKCKACGYSELLGGGAQVGMTSIQWTLRCHDCAALVDVLVSERPWDVPEGWTPESYACPKSKEHRVELWSESGGCPKCDGVMSLDEQGQRVLWD
jgi:hypothetical protein